MACRQAASLTESKNDVAFRKAIVISWSALLDNLEPWKIFMDNVHVEFQALTAIEPGKPRTRSVIVIFLYGRVIINFLTVGTTIVPSACSSLISSGFFMSSNWTT